MIRRNWLTWRLLCGATVMIVVGWAGGFTPSFAADEDGSAAAEIKPYTGPPIILDEPEPQPPASLVERQVNTVKFDDGTIRVERQIARFSDNHLEADGFYREYYPNGQKFVEGQHRGSRQDGTWTYWHENGTKCREVTYREGQPDGSWEVSRADGTLAAKRSFKNGRRDGVWVIYDDSGEQSLREESYQDGKQDGVWKVWFPSGQLHRQITFKQGQRHGHAQEWDEKGNPRADVNYVDNKLHGPATVWSLEGKKMSQQYDQGKLVSETKE